MRGSDSGFIDFDSSDAMSFSTLEVSIAEIKQLKLLNKIDPALEINRTGLSLSTFIM